MILNEPNFYSLFVGNIMKHQNLEKKIKEWKLTTEQSELVKDLVDKNKSIIKNMNVNILNFNQYNDLINALKSLQVISIANKVSKIIPKEIVLYKNEKIVNLLQILLNYVEEDYVRKLLFKNRDNISSSDSLEKIIFKEYQLYVDSSKKEIEVKISDMKSVKVILNESNLMILRINSYKSLVNINTSKNWCITKEKNEFKNYIDQYGYFYLLINYRKNSNDKDYMIGFNKGKTFIGFDNKNTTITESYIKNIIGCDSFLLIEQDLNDNYKIEESIQYQTTTSPLREMLLDTLEERLVANKITLQNSLNSQFSKHSHI
jgi:hypothetical protein